MLPWILFSVMHLFLMSVNDANYLVVDEKSLSGIWQLLLWEISYKGSILIALYAPLYREYVVVPLCTFDLFSNANMR